MSSSELSSGEGTTAARRRGSARPQWSCAARSDAEPGGRGPASCKHVRSPEARQIECKAAARAAQGAGRTGAPHAATRRAPRCRPRQEGPHRTLGDVDRVYLSHTAPERVGNVPAPWLFVVWCATPCPLASSPCLSAQPLSSMGRILHGSDARACLHRTRWGLQPRAAWRRSLAHALVRQHSHT